MGETVTYTLTADNLGPNDATGVVVSDTLPAGVTYVSNDGGAAYDGVNHVVTWTIGALAAAGRSNPQNGW